jgi:hypothetical protein
VREETKTWLDGILGWAPEGSTVETFWIGDPAVDPDRSDREAYKHDLGKEHLVLRDGARPARMLVSLPTAAQWGNIRPHIQELGIESAAVIAFELCVRFPDVPDARPEQRLGFQRLPEPFMRAVSVRDPVLIAVVGMWLINRYMLTEDEKKTSSPGSTRKTSSRPGSTDAAASTEKTSARNEPSGSTDAQTSQGPDQRPQMASSGSGAAAQHTSDGGSTDALAPTCDERATGAGCQP